MIEEAYCSFEVAKLLKEKGYPQTSDRCHYIINEDGGYYRCFEDRCGFGDYDIITPTHQTTMRWFREVHNIDIEIHAEVGMLGIKGYVPMISTYKPNELFADDPSKLRQYKRGLQYKDDRGVIPALQDFETYEEAVEAALKYCLEHLK